MELIEYKCGDIVEVKVNNPRLNYCKEWREGEVIDVRTIHARVGERHRPYPIVIVRFNRTYCNATDNYEWIDKTIPVYICSSLTFYDKENDEGFIYKDTIRLKL